MTDIQLEAADATARDAAHPETDQAAQDAAEFRDPETDGAQPNEAALIEAEPASEPAPPAEAASDVVAESEEELPGEAGAGLPEADFASLGLSAEIVRAVDEMGYRTPTPIQAQAIPYVLMGRDVLGVAQTGTGKTASFVLPMLDILAGSRARARMPRSLILEPTRELALQVAENFVRYGKHLKLSHALLIGGESMAEQKEALMRGVDVLIATPGRLIDLFERGGLLLTDTRLLVIDEADRMLDMGFIPDVERIVGLLPRTRQTLFFSATMAPEIRRLADAFLQNPREVKVSRAASVAPTIVAGLTLVAEHDKREALRRLIRGEEVQNALIFCNRKRDVDVLYKSLKRHGFSAGALHGDMSQPERFSTLGKFKAGQIRLLVCSDVAARGLDIGGLSHVFNFDVPIHAEDYVHRIGRTGRAGMTGHAYTLATPYERRAVDAIETLIQHPIPRLQVEGLDAVDWAGDDEKPRRGRGSSRSAKPATGGRKGAASAAGEREEAKPAREGGRERTRDRARRPRDQAEEEARTAPSSRPDTSRAEAPRADASSNEARGRDDQARRREGEPRGRGAYQDYGNPGRRRDRRDDEVGSSPVGFGDDVPAFMLLKVRRPHGQGHAHGRVSGGNAEAANHTEA